MQAVTTKKITDKEAVNLAREMDDNVIYIHRSSGHIRLAYYTGEVRKNLTIEEADRYGTYLGFTPVPGAYATY